MEAAQEQYPEKRRHPRYSCDLGVEVCVAGAKAGYWGTLADICFGGCYVNSFSPLPVGTAVLLQLKNKNLEITIAGKVVTSHPGVGMGVQFSGFVPQKGEAELKSLLEELAESKLTR